MSETAYIGVGSNLGNPLENCRKALQLMDELEGCTLVGRSRFYRTTPVGVEGQDWYVNAVASLDTERAPLPLLRGLLALEAQMGRVRKKRWDARVIDLDLLLYGERVIDEKGVVVPHPRMHERRFVLAPMVDLAPNLLHPMLGKRMIELLAAFQDQGQEAIPLGEK